MLRPRVLFFASVVLGITGCALGPLIDQIAASQGDTADYTIHEVSIFAPNGTNSGTHGPGTYTLRWRFLLAGGPSPGGPPNGVRPVVALIDADNAFRGADDVIAGEQHVPVNTLVTDPFPSSNFDEATFTLSCIDGQVVGNIDGSGEGTTEVFGRIERANGGGRVNSLNRLTVECP
jgi:hypothetical protein